MANPRPIHENFSDAYSQRSSAPPSAGGIRNPQRVNRQNRVQNPPRQQVTYQNSARNTKVERKVATKELEPEYGIAGRRVRRAYTRLKLRAKQLPGKAADLELRAKATRVNSGIWSWAIPLWLTFQLPFAILSNVVFAFAVIEKELSIENITEVRDEDGNVTRAAKTIVKFFGRIVDSAAKTLNGFINELTGFNIGEFLAAFIPSNLWGVLFTVFFAYALILFMIIAIIYTFSGMRGLLGNGTTFKLTSVVLMFAGYIFPLTNMLPWFMLWTATVWRYPK